ncbi:stage V sporulation protein AE [Aureibacillus halotolerans]|uniref:Stage V sporulation protein AE n=1 Tax=Aureibacillus halotolerans TaxID=1508390 RepID=A0A4R6UA85_9BACI|nr:stage V sporulation protein AE [Aureibacillus halotolerans]TDQ41595.1 stage V sporulation protein AE [Aureibacillus halotolerans]
MTTKNVIFVTDGDEYAERNLVFAAKTFNAECLLQSRGNPSLRTGKQLLDDIQKSNSDLLFLMFDDCGSTGTGPGEMAMLEIAADPSVKLLGVVAVASKTRKGGGEWTLVNVSIDRYGELTQHSIDKSGVQDIEIGRIHGDTVDCLQKLPTNLIVGIGDIGKMDGRDDVKKGAPITCLAISTILERSGFLYGERNEDEDKNAHQHKH